MARTASVLLITWPHPVPRSRSTRDRLEARLAAGGFATTATASAAGEAILVGVPLAVIAVWALNRTRRERR
jgi:hypothetical protein